jgi:pSer/pThr/pTyr-binding forkhead associated (FHA) protein
MPATQTTIGRDSGSIFAGDSYLSPRHATFVPKGKLATIRDESSLNGIYKKIGRDEPVELGFGDIFRIGQEILRIEQLVPAPKSADGVERLGSPARGYVARLALLIGRDTTGNAYPIPESGLHLGRERGDVLFPEDGYVSGLHCRVSWANGRIYVTDLGSSNGSFIRLMRDATVTTGDILLMGQQLFRVAINA